MIEIVEFSDLKEGDIILVEGMDFKNEIKVITIKKITKDNTLVPAEMGGLDYTPENPEAIVRIGTKEEEPILTILAKKMNLAFSKDWQKQINKK